MTALYSASKIAAIKNICILADGGISKSGDIVKALTLSNAVICGSLLAGCNEAPGRIIEIDGKILNEVNIFMEISNSRYTGTNFLIAPRARIVDGRLDITLLRPGSRRRLLRLFPSIYSGRHFH